MCQEPLQIKGHLRNMSADFNSVWIIFESNKQKYYKTKNVYTDWIFNIKEFLLDIILGMIVVLDCLCEKHKSIYHRSISIHQLLVTWHF